MQYAKVLRSELSHPQQGRGLAPRWDGRPFRPEVPSEIARSDSNLSSFNPGVQSKSAGTGLRFYRTTTDTGMFGSNRTVLGVLLSPDVARHRDEIPPLFGGTCPARSWSGAPRYPAWETSGHTKRTTSEEESSSTNIGEPARLNDSGRRGFFFLGRNSSIISYLFPRDHTQELCHLPFSLICSSFVMWYLPAGLVRAPSRSL